jgi:hypothetical protein
MNCLWFIVVGHVEKPCPKSMGVCGNVVNVAYGFENWKKYMGKWFVCLN